MTSRTREGLRGRQPLRHAGRPSRFRDVAHARRVERRVHERDGLRPQPRLVPKGGLQVELRKVDDGEHAICQWFVVRCNSPACKAEADSADSVRWSSSKRNCPDTSDGVCASASAPSLAFHTHTTRSATDQLVRRDDEQGAAVLLQQSPEAMPHARRDFAELRGRVELQVEDDERKVAVAQQNVGRFERFVSSSATHPKQSRQHVGFGRIHVEAVRAVHQREEPAARCDAAQERVDDLRAAGAIAGADEFREFVFGKAAA